MKVAETAEQRGLLSQNLGDDAHARIGMDVSGCSCVVDETRSLACYGMLE